MPYLRQKFTPSLLKLTPVQSVTFKLTPLQSVTFKVKDKIISIGEFVAPMVRNANRDQWGDYWFTEILQRFFRIWDREFAGKLTHISMTSWKTSPMFQQKTSFIRSFYSVSNNVKVKVKCTLVQALRLCTGCTTHRGSRGIAVLYRHWGSVQAVWPIGGVEV